MLAKPVELKRDHLRMVEILTEAGVPRNTARVLTFIAVAGKTFSAQIQSGTGMRQPEVSIALKQLTERKWISRQSVQNTLSEMARRVDVARVYTHNIVERQLAAEHNLITEVCFAKNTAVEAGEWVANQAVQLFGGMGYMAESEIERQYRDMRILGIGGGTTEILTSLAAKMLGYQS